MQTLLNRFLSLGQGVGNGVMAFREKLGETWGGTGSITLKFGIEYLRPLPKSVKGKFCWFQTGPYGFFPETPRQALSDKNTETQMRDHFLIG